MPLTCEWMKMMWCIWTTGYYAAIKRNEIMPSEATWMNLEGYDAITYMCAI